MYCLSKALARDPKDADARWDRAVLYAELGEQAKAIKQFEMVRLLCAVSSLILQDACSFLFIFSCDARGLS